MTAVPHPPVMRSVVLPCAPARAFELFTGRISEWWPPARRHTGEADSTIVLSAVGRFYERGRAGAEIELGAVLAWEPPARLVLDWYPGTDREHPTRVEVRFTAEGAAATRVSIVHGPTDASADLFGARAPRSDASWALVLAALEGAARALDNE